ncbi:MAG TPA: hypothetical protein VGM56_11960 [Byssovorax sp.]|jgi:hypothetical protein
MLARSLAAALLVAWSIAASACAHDVVGADAPSDDKCGDGVVGPTEACDEETAGCTNCQATPGYECDGTACYIPCGDGIDGTGPHCDGAHKPEACDLTGYWVARETDYTKDEIVGMTLTSSTWYVYRLSQTGDAFTVDESLHCGIHVTGSATVDYTPGTLKGLIYANDQTSAGAHGPRAGRFSHAGAGCMFEIDRWYDVRGGVDSLLPGDFSQHPPLASLTPLPTVPDPVNPRPGPVAGATDPDGDGLPGAAYVLTSLVNGTRNSIQRDYKEYATPEGQPIPPGAVTFTAPGAFDLEESILSVTGCGDGCSLIASQAYVDPELVPFVTLRFLGKDLDGPGVTSVIAGALRSSVDLDLTTCENARAVLPHDTSMP